MSKCPFYKITSSLLAQARLLTQAVQKRKTQAEMNGFKYHHCTQKQMGLNITVALETDCSVM